jgi:anoctamin-10
LAPSLSKPIPHRYSDFLHGLSTTNLASVGDASAKLAPADRLRLIHGFITSTPEDGGLGINPDSPAWSPRVQSVMALHDHDFNGQWIRSWTTHAVGARELDGIRDQFGESVALYFSFLSGYTKFLFVPSALGVLFYLFGTPYSGAYSIALVVWATSFAEWWRVRERVLSVRWSTRGSFSVERRRAQYVGNTSWQARELRTAASVPLILLAAGFLACLLTGLFVFEAFLSQLYTGPGHQYIVSALHILVKFHEY